MAETPEEIFARENGLPLATPPRKRAGRPRWVAPQDFTGALAALSPQHAEFARGIVAGLTQAAAYRSAFPTANEKTARSNGKELAQRKGVAAAIRLGRDEMAREVRQSVKYDLVEAHNELNRHIAGAIASDNFNAVASLVREKLRLHKLVDNKELAVANAGFVFKIEKAGDAQVVHAQPILTGAADGDEKDS